MADVCENCDRYDDTGDALPAAVCMRCWQEWLTERDRLRAEVRTLTASLDLNMRLSSSNAQELVQRAADLESQRDQLRQMIRKLLLSADAVWEEKRMGHDWAETVEMARILLKG